MNTIPHDQDGTFARPWLLLLTDEEREAAKSIPPACNEDGIDLGQIRWFLSLTPAQRLETLQNFVDFVVEARNANETAKVR